MKKKDKQSRQARKQAQIQAELEQLQRPRNYLYELLVLAELLAFVVVTILVTGEIIRGILIGVILFAVVAFLLRIILQYNHINGMRLIDDKCYPEAAEFFRKSYEFFNKHYWIDKFRFITMFSSNYLPFRDMDLNNYGVCLTCMEEHEKALEVYHRLRALNPDYPDLAESIETVEEALAKRQKKEKEKEKQRKH